MQILYKDYQFKFNPIIIVALGYVPIRLTTELESLGFNKTEIKKHINKMQGIVTAGTVKICKTFLKF